MIFQCLRIFAILSLVLIIDTKKPTDFVGFEFNLKENRINFMIIQYRYNSVPNLKLFTMPEFECELKKCAIPANCSPVIL